jgi:hypothetical protein
MNARENLGLSFQVWSATQYAPDASGAKMQHKLAASPFGGISKSYQVDGMINRIKVNIASFNINY